jgi:hypothetical protein
MLSNSGYISVITLLHSGNWIHRYFLQSAINNTTWCHMWKSNQIRTCRGWLVVLNRSSLPATTSTFSRIFSLLAILFPAGFINSGKVNGTFKEYSPLEHTTFWDQLILIDKFEPPSICYKPHIQKHKQHHKHINTPH